MSLRQAKVAALTSILTSSAATMAADVIYVPAEFPHACAVSLTRSHAHCPTGVSRRPADFCSQSLAGLRAWAWDNGLDLCGVDAKGTTPGTYDQVLLVDDRALSADLSQLLGAVLTSGRIATQAGRFRNQANVARRVMIVGEASGTSMQDPRDDKPSGPGQQPGGGTGASSPAHGTSNRGTGSEEGDSTNRVDMEFRREEMRTGFHLNFSQFKADLAAVIALTVPDKFAYMAVDESEYLRGMHKQFAEDGFDNDDFLEVWILITYEGNPANITDVEIEQVSGVRR